MRKRYIHSISVKRRVRNRFAHKIQSSSKHNEANSMNLQYNDSNINDDNRNDNDENYEGNDDENYEDNDDENYENNGEDYEDENYEDNDNGNYESDDNGNDEDNDNRNYEGDDNENYEDDDNENYEGDDNENYEGDNNENYEDMDECIIDEALKQNELPNNNGNFWPYFESITAALLFCWVYKHNISTKAYDELIDILQHPQFCINDIITNIRRFRKWRYRLPLISIRSRCVKISTKKTPSTTCTSKPAYYLSVSDIIWYVLNNRSLFNKMYFGPALEVKEKSEFWHGDLWGESPQFGQETIVIKQGIYYDI